jgi:hypothetical protein
MRKAHYTRYKNEDIKANFWKSPTMRFLLPQYADWTIRENPYATHHQHQMYSLERPYL